MAMEMKDTPKLKKAIREYRAANCRGEGGRAAADQMEKALREGYELGWLGAMEAVSVEQDWEGKRDKS